MSALPEHVEVDQAPVLRADDLTRFYEVNRGLFSGSATLKALNGASFELRPGETLAVVGESGCGKSTLARVLTMIEPPTSGRLEIDGGQIALGDKRPDAALRRKVQIVFQNPYGSLNPRKKVGATLEEPLLINTEFSPAERRARVEAILAKVGLRPEHFNRFPHMFSGGQRQRIAVARALMLEPKIIVLDEPVSALDLSIQAQILNLLRDLQKEFNLAYVFISHDLSVVRYIADKVMVMYLGRPVEFATTAQIFDNPQHPYTRALFSASPVADPNHARARIKLTGELPSPLNPPSGCAFNPRCPACFERCLAERPKLHAWRDAGHETACHAIEEGRI
ncbi:MAG: dipeptide ABC transporter ATP-binding protein [Geminicoccaceae bacterium]